MANKTWVGTDSGNEGDVNVAANWSPSGVPTAADSVFFTSGSQDVTGNLSTLASTNLTAFVRSSGYTGTIGSSGSPLELGNVDTFRYHATTGEAFIHMHTVGTDAHITGVPVSTDGLVLVDDGALDITADLHVYGPDVKGQVQIEGGAGLSDIYVAGVDAGAVLTVGASCTGFDVLDADSGTLTLSTVPGTRLEVRESAIATVATGAGTPAWLKAASGGTLYYNGDGNPTLVEVSGSTSTVSLESNVTAAGVTVGRVRALNGGVFDGRNTLGTVTVTTTTERGGFIRTE